MNCRGIVDKLFESPMIGDVGGKEAVRNDILNWINSHWFPDAYAAGDYTVSITNAVKLRVTSNNVRVLSLDPSVKAFDVSGCDRFTAVDVACAYLQTKIVYSGEPLS